MNKKSYLLMYLTLFVMFFIPLKDKVRSPNGVIYNASFMDWSNSTLGFYVIIILTALISAIILFLAFRTKFIKSLEIDNERRLVSDDIFIIFYFIGWVIYSLPLMFRDNTDIIKQYFDLYLYFTIISASYLILVKLNHLIKKLRDRDKSISLFELGNAWIYLDIFVISASLMMCVFVISVLLPEPQSGFLTEDGRDFLLFMTFVSMPVEEIVFRAMAIDIVLAIVKEIIYDIKKISREERLGESEFNKKVSNFAWVIAIITSGLAFAFYHIDRYGFDTWTIVYLLIMGVVMGFARYLGGLTSAYLIHLINNFIVSKSATILIAGSVISPLPILFLIGISVIIMALLKYKNKLIWRKG